MAKRKAAPKPRRESLSDWQRGIEERLEALERGMERAERRVDRLTDESTPVITHWGDTCITVRYPPAFGGKWTITEWAAAPAPRLPWYMRGSDYDRRRNG